MDSIKELSHDAQVALVSLVKAIALANREITDGEIVIIDRIAEELGNDTYRSLLNESDNCYSSIEDLKTGLADITDKPTQELIYGTVWEESAADPMINHKESELLDWLKTTWNI